MVDSADLGFYGAAWRFTDFCQHLYARSVYLQLVLKSCELPGSIRASRVVFGALAERLFCTRSRRFETRARPPLARRYPRDFTFYLEIPFLDCSFATVVVGAGVDRGLHRLNGAKGMSDPPSPRLRRARHRR